MNEKYNQEIEELLNAYVDGEASQRQQTELKRLMMHDPSIPERISRLHRQKELLNALPVESAPEGLAEDIRCALERKLILNNISAGHHAAETGGFKKLLAAAAMLFLPLGVLGLIVFEIIKPAEPVTGPVAVNTENKGQEAAAGLPFSGVLTFETAEFAAVSNYIDKKIFDQGLSERKETARTDNSVCYTISAPPQKIAALVDSMQDSWKRSHSVWLSVAADTDAGKIDIPAVKPEQVKTLALEGSGSALSQLAADYASDNQKNSFYAKKDSGELGPDEFPPLDQPIMTGRYKPSAFNESQEGSIQLQIVIQRPQN